MNVYLLETELSEESEHIVIVLAVPLHYVSKEFFTQI